jgi:glycosyltransferase involved in cell wall biosynthesis
MSKPTVVHLITSLKFGGAERFLLDVFPHLDHKTYNHIIYPLMHTGELLSDDKYPVYEYNTSPFWLTVFTARKGWHKWFKPLLPFYYFYRSIRYLNSNTSDTTIVYICQLGLAFSFADKCKNWLSKNPCHWVLRVGSDIDSPIYFPKPIESLCVKAVYPLFKTMLSQAPTITTVDPELSQKIIKRFKQTRSKVHTISNCCQPIPPTKETEPTSHLNASIEKQLGDKWFIAAGRLHYQKGFDFLIKAFKTFQTTHPDYKLVILGEGSQRQELERLIQQLNLNNHVLLPGFIKNPERLIAKARACIVSSRSEGFCKVIVEAMMVGQIVISDDCDFGPRTIIKHCENGFLYTHQTIDALIQQLKEVIELPASTREAISDAAQERASDFSPLQVAKTYQALLNNHKEGKLKVITI